MASLLSTQADLATTVTELATTKADLATTVTELATTKADLATTVTELATTKSTVTTINSSLTNDTYTKVEVEDRFNNVLNITNGLNEAKVNWTKYNDDMDIIQSSLGDILAEQEIVQLKTKAYLNGGYKSGVVQEKRIQRFNSITETGGDLGVIASITSGYRPGGSSKNQGYFFGSPTVSGNSSVDGKSVEMITYLTETCNIVSSGGLGFSVYGTLYDINIQSTVFGTDATKWLKIVTDTNTVTTLTDSTAAAHSRQMLSGETFGYAKNSTSTQFKYDYTTNVSTAIGTAFTITNIPTGLVKDKNSGYWIGYTDTNFKVDFTTDTVTTVTPFTVSFGESNTLGTETHGYAMGGYNGAQHGLVQKFDWVTESGSTVLGGDLSYEQSSAGTAEA